MREDPYRIVWTDSEIRNHLNVDQLRFLNFTKTAGGWLVSSNGRQLRAPAQRGVTAARILGSIVSYLNKLTDRKIK